MNKEQIIQGIADRIKVEETKHSHSIPDWHKIAAAKIYATWAGTANHKLTFKINMNKKNIDKEYFERFIQSLETDYTNWKKENHGGAGWSWSEYYSPNYESGGHRVSFGFSLNYTGAWVDGHFQWAAPLRVFNPFTIRFWRFYLAMYKMKRYLKNREQQKHLKLLTEAFDNLKNDHHE